MKKKESGERSKRKSEENATGRLNKIGDSMRKEEKENVVNMKKREKKSANKRKIEGGG